MAQFERLYIAQYCAEKWAEGGYTLGVPLGPIPPDLVKSLGYEGASAYFRPWRPEVDAVKFFSEGLLLLEGKVFKVLDALAKLRWYGELALKTEEFRSWLGAPVTLRVVTPRATDVFRTLAEASGVQIDIYQTPEVMAHAAKYEKYWTAEYQRERQLRQEKLKELGLG